MGNFIEKIQSISISAVPKKILIMGLDAAGKTTILYRMKRNTEVTTTIPTIGFNVEETKISGMQVTCWDVGGRSPLRALWRYYYENTDGIIYVIDANDKERIDQARDELKRILTEDALIGVPVLIFGNKNDLPNSWKKEDMETFINVKSLSPTPRVSDIRMCSAKDSGVGLFEGVEWLQHAMAGQR